MQGPSRAIGHILIIEDDNDTSEILGLVLRAVGYVVVNAENGLLGLDALHGLSSGQRPDVIILDLVMPVCNGWEFMIAKNSDVQVRSIPVVVVTATPVESSRVKGIEHVAVFLQKPYTPEKILEAVEEARTSR
jgi:CheY-like chemotaxis protein